MAVVEKEFPDPEVDGVGVLLQGYPRPGDVLLDVREQGGIFVAEVVILSACVRKIRGGGKGESHVSVRI